MAVSVFTDGSVRGNKARGAYIITKNGQLGFGKDLKYNEINYFRTTEMENSNIDDVEIKVIVHAIKHALKLHPETTHIRVYTDSQNSINKFEVPYIRYIHDGADPIVEDFLSYLDKIGRKDLKLKFVHVKAHTNSGDVAAKMNFMCDVLCKA